MDFVELYQARDRFRDEIIRQIGDDLSGYVLEDAAIDYLEQTPLSKLDPNNILDAQGIKKITELTASENVRTNELRRNEEMQIKKKDVETAGGPARTGTPAGRRRGPSAARDRLGARPRGGRGREDPGRGAHQGRAGASAGRAAIAVQQENVQREKEVAENNRKRAVAIEEEKVIRGASWRSSIARRKSRCSRSRRTRRSKCRRRRSPT
jgi:uncharacterized membrane protein YqiK